MSVAPDLTPEPTTESPAAAPTPAAPTPPAETAQRPPWADGEFDPEKAWNLIQNLQGDKKRLASREVLTPEQKADLEELKKLRESSKTELEKAQDATQRAAQRAEALVARAVKAEVKALASQFADPSDASAFLDLAKYATPDGEIDTEAISRDLADLLSRKPHLGKDVGPKAPAPNPAQGSSAAGAAAEQKLSRADVERLASEGKHAEIEKARIEGRIDFKS